MTQSVFGISEKLLKMGGAEMYWRTGLKAAYSIVKGKAITNFPETLPSPQSDLAQQLLKDPYTFDFLTITDNAKEKELEQNLLLHLRDFMIELEKGFAFIGNQSTGR